MRNVFCCILLFGHFWAYATEESVDTYFPRDAPLGLPLDRFKALHSEATVSELYSSGPENSVKSGDQVFIETQSDVNTPLFNQYHFIDSCLRAIVRTRSNRGRIDVAIRSAKIESDLNRLFTRGQDATVVRFDEKLTLKHYAAQFWRDGSGSQNVYFLSTNQEETLVLFDPRALTEKAFFPDPTGAKIVERAAQAVRRQIERVTVDGPNANDKPAFIGSGAKPEGSFAVPTVPVSQTPATGLLFISICFVTAVTSFGIVAAIIIVCPLRKACHRESGVSGFWRLGFCF
ncbi:MAG: hypothetical protein WDN28_25200 [Chthoniobacter sp.]